MEKKKRVLFITIGTFVILLFGILAAIYVFDYGKTDPFNFIFNNFISITSFILSFIALIVAVITYISIDAVNSSTSMEGNVLENDMYSVEYSSLLKKLYSPDKQKITEIFVAFLSKRNRYTNCITFSAHLQRTIDNLIWLNYINCKNPEFISAIKDFIKRTVKKVKHYEAINSGLELLLEENVKLIISVAKIYTGESTMLKQSDGKNKSFIDDYFFSKYVDNKNFECTIQDVRGKMAKNPITQMIYFDCTGRYLLSQITNASSILDLGEVIETSYIFKDVINVQNIEKYNIVIEKALQCLKVAHGLSQSNILWNAQVEEDLLLAYAIKYFLDKENGTKELLLKQGDKAKNTYKKATCLLSLNQEFKNSSIHTTLVDKATHIDLLMNDLIQNV